MGASVTGTATWPYAVYFFRSYRGLLALAFILMVISAGVEALMIGLLLPLFRDLLGGGSVPAAGAALQWLDRVTSLVPFEDPLVRSFICFAVVAVAAEMIKLATAAVLTHFTWIAWRDTTDKVFAHLLDADVRRIVRTPQGEWIHRVVAAPFQMTQLFGLYPLMTIQVLRAVAVLALLLSISITMAGVGVLLGLAFYAFTAYMGKYHLFTLGAGQVRANETQMAVVNETVTGIREIKIYDVVMQWLDKFSKATDAYTAQAIKQTVLQQLPANLLGLFFVGVICLGLVMLQIFAGESYSSLVPVMTVYVVGFGRVSTELAGLGKYRMAIAGMLPFSAVVKAELETSHSKQNGEGRLDTPIHSIEFRDVSYTHPGRPQILDGISFIVREGQMTAIVGASGSGKSTVIDLLLRLYDPAEGAVWVNGRDVRTLDLKTWHKQIGYLGQEAFLFHASIWDNLVMARPVDVADVHAAAESAQANQFILRSERGYETHVGNRGLKFSGGERQRLALARALVGRPSVLILDEATSNLESDTEKIIIESLRKEFAQGIFLIVSHRLSAVRGADQIVVLDQGRVVEVGTHSALLNHKSTYYRLCRSQGLS